MPTVTYGPKVEARALRLFKVLLLLAAGEVENADHFNIRYSLSEEDSPHPKLTIKTKLRVLEALVSQDGQKGSLTKEQIRQGLRQMENFLKILKDHRVQKRGLDEWHFTLVLWSRDIQKNLKIFHQEWQQRKPGTDNQRNEKILDSSPSNLLPHEEQPIKFYIYISQTKVDLLYSQLAIAQKKDSDVDLSIPEKLLAVRHYLETGKEVGTFSNPKTYISGTLPLSYGIVSNYAADIAYFGSVINGKILSLIGSSSSLVGAVNRSYSNHVTFYYTLRFLNSISNRNKPVNKQPKYNSFKEASDIALKCIPPEKYNLEFIAKILYSEPNLIVATPFYVALV